MAATQSINHLNVDRVCIHDFLGHFDSPEDSAEWNIFLMNMFLVTPLNHAILICINYNWNMVEPIDEKTGITEALVFSEAFWTQGERDASAQLALM